MTTMYDDKTEWSSIVVHLRLNNPPLTSSVSFLKGSVLTFYISLLVADRAVNSARIDAN